MKRKTLLILPPPQQQNTKKKTNTTQQVGFYLVWWYKDVKCFNESPVHMLGWVYNYAYVGTVLILFINFSIWTYVFKPSAPKRKTA